MKTLIRNTLLNPEWHKRLLAPVIAAVLAYGIFAVPFLAFFLLCSVFCYALMGLFLALAMSLVAYSFWLKDGQPYLQDLFENILEMLSSSELLVWASFFGLGLGLFHLSTFPEHQVSLMEFSRAFWAWGREGGAP